ncbi:hypothetical protein N7G274_009173 [Stereocaulon virgatum]|uniref:Uncharacterized protein n=1 Tax=Stereocaulon virgatum TaxID=373712 RepID=A0ABR3ZX90_9LECA
MRRVGTRWWVDEQERVNVELGEREMPDDFGRVGMAISMDERMSVMREYAAVFYEDADAVDELREGM